MALWIFYLREAGIGNFNWGVAQARARPVNVLATTLRRAGLDTIFHGQGKDYHAPHISHGIQEQ
jgi:hypothetical protein